MWVWSECERIRHRCVLLNYPLCVSFTRLLPLKVIVLLVCSSGHCLTGIISAWTTEMGSGQVSIGSVSVALVWISVEGGTDDLQ